MTSSENEWQIVLEKQGFISQLMSCEGFGA